MEGYDPRFRGKYINETGVMTQHEAAELLSEIIRATSENPNEAPCAQKLIEICEREGLTYEVVPAAPGRDNIMITLGAAHFEEKKHALLIHGHYDTVPAMEMPDPFQTTVRNNRMWGRGTSDQKSGLAAAICAAIAAKRQGWEFSRSFCIACVIDEESQHRGSYKLAQSNLRADYAIVTEPTEGRRVEFGCRGTTPIRIHIQGRTAHAGSPELGINAIGTALPVLNRLFSMQCGVADLGEFGILKGTQCVSMMHAGSAYNNVPGEAEIWMDRRTVPGETSASVLEEIRQVLKDAAAEDPNLIARAQIARPDWTWAPIIERGLNPVMTDADCPLYDVLLKAREQSRMANENAHPGTVKHAESTARDHESTARYEMPALTKGLFNGYNDMDFLVNDLGIPTLTYGPGELFLAHGPKEEVDLDEYCMVADIFCSTVKMLCTQ